MDPSIRFSRTGIALAQVLTVLLLGSAAHAQSVEGIPGNAGNLDDGGPVDLHDVLSLRGADPSWIPTPAEILSLDCDVEADPPFLTTANGVKVVRGVGHWTCNHAVPGNALETCLDLVFPSVACNEKVVVRPSNGLTVKVDFACVPGVYLTMATGTNPFVPPETDHSDYALIVLPTDCIVPAGP